MNKIFTTVLRAVAAAMCVFCSLSMFGWTVDDNGFAYSLSVTNPSSSRWLVGTFGW